MASFQKTVDRLDKIANKQTKEIIVLAAVGDKVNSIAITLYSFIDRAAEYLYNLVVDAEDAIEDYIDDKIAEADNEAQAAEMLSEKLKESFGLK
ncbi:hypothetical protein A7981_05560 [Methylovorus sp. MM2]|nr:hypothetical protein A7981_05560 [Methylovorus sp. MM2]